MEDFFSNLKLIVKMGKTYASKKWMVKQTQQFFPFS